MEHGTGRLSGPAADERGVVPVGEATNSERANSERVTARGRDEPALRQLLAGLAAVRGGDFRARLPHGDDPLMNEIADVFNGMTDQLSMIASGVARAAREVGVEGRLGRRLRAPDVPGAWRELIESTNMAVGNLGSQVRDISQVAAAVARGDLSQKITVDARGEILELKNTINTMVDQLSSFAGEVTRVAREVGTEGRLGGQAFPGVGGTWRDLTDSVNFMAGNLTGQVRSISQVAAAVARGDLSQKITVDARGEILELKNTINTMVDQLSSFAGEVTRVAREVGTEGRLGGQADVKGVSGTWKDLTESVNVMAANLTVQVRSIAEVTTSVAKGDLTQKIRVDARGEILELKETINTMVDRLSSFADEVIRVAGEVGTQGNLGGQAVARGVSGTWRDLTDNVNSMASNLTSQVRNIAQVTTAVARGDLSKKIDVDARGEILELKTTINTMVDQLSSFAAEVTRVAREVGTEGILGGQAEVEGVSGTWKRLTENVNELAGNLTRQVRAIAAVTSAVAAGDLTGAVSVEARGEVAELKDNINAMVRSLYETTRANQEQDWLKTNLARISGLMQKHRDLDTVTELVMDELAPLVGAQYGTFFLAGSGSGSGAPALRLIASFGYQAHPDVPREFGLGESLVGQVARTRRSIFVDRTPAHYVKISSSLGHAGPVNLIVLPVLFEDHVLGVIELASFTPFTQVHRDFLDRLMDIIGVNINIIVANSRTDALLAESQRLAAELRARSEELQSRQDELQRSNAELAEKAALLARQNHDIEVKNFEIEQARQEIEERARQLGLSSRYKSEFLANMSHELRTPLNSLLILARLLAQNPANNLSPKEVEYANVIHSAGSDLLQLINDILDLSKVEAGKIDVHLERFALGALLDDVRGIFCPVIEEKGLRFAVDVAPDVPDALVSDQHRLLQVLRNLLSNAVKFTQRGGVELRIRMVSGRVLDDERRPAVAFAVTDTGIGIAEENLDRLFGAFQQGDGSTSRRFGGTGLGLSIAREVAALLGGVIRVQSEFGKGSTFTLYLPLSSPGAIGEKAHGATQPAVSGPPAPAAPPLPLPPVPSSLSSSPSSYSSPISHSAPGSSDVSGSQAPVSAPIPAPALALAPGGNGVPAHATDDVLRGRRILVIDDDVRNVFAITSVLELHGLTVIHAPDGRIGIDILVATDGVELVLVDVMMPEMDGYATMTAIREMARFGALPIIAVTAKAMPGDRQKCLAAGADDYVTKPVDTDELLTCIRQRLTRQEPGENIR